GGTRGSQDAWDRCNESLQSQYQRGVSSARSSGLNVINSTCSQPQIVATPNYTPTVIYWSSSGSISCSYTVEQMPTNAPPKPDPARIGYLPPTAQYNPPMNPGPPPATVPAPINTIQQPPSRTFIR
ncbi:MAG: hypothetical protein ACRCZP_07345, partial [Phycicoccus sp.]